MNCLAQLIQIYLIFGTFLEHAFRKPVWFFGFLFRFAFVDDYYPVEYSYLPEPIKYYKPKPVEYYKPKPVEYYKPEPVERYKSEPVEYYKPEPVEYYKPEPAKPEPLRYNIPKPRRELRDPYDPR